jgi:hypothetical protein
MDDASKGEFGNILALGFKELKEFSKCVNIQRMLNPYTTPELQIIASIAVTLRIILIIPLVHNPGYVMFSNSSYIP